MFNKAAREGLHGLLLIIDASRFRYFTTIGR